MQLHSGSKKHRCGKQKIACTEKLSMFPLHNVSGDVTGGVTKTEQLTHYSNLAFKQYDQTSTSTTTAVQSGLSEVAFVGGHQLH